MPQKDADGMERWDVHWTIEGAKKTRSGVMRGLHEGEVAGARQIVKANARKGDTITINVI